MKKTALNMIENFFLIAKVAVIAENKSQYSKNTGEQK